MKDIKILPCPKCGKQPTAYTRERMAETTCTLKCKPFLRKAHKIVTVIGPNVPQATRKAVEQWNKIASGQPTHWTLGWSFNLELGFDDGKYLPRKAAILLYPQYFDEKGEPIKDALPIERSNR